MKNHKITVSVPGKIHLLGEHMVVYGKPALLAAVGLRVTVTLKPHSSVIARSAPPRSGKYSWGETTKQSWLDQNINKIATLPSVAPQGYSLLHSGARNDEIKKIIEPIIKKELKLKQIPSYKLEISSELPIGAGLGSSAAVSAAYIAALLSFLKVKWDLNLINKLTYEAEKVFHGNPSGGDNTTVVYGGLISYIKGKPIQPIPFSIPKKLAKNFVLINTGKPQETTREMVEMVKSKIKNKQSLRSKDLQKSKIWKIFDSQEQLVRELLPAVQAGNEKELMRIIKEGEGNLEKIGVVSTFVKKIIRQIEKAGGVAKICGAGGKTKATGILLCYHPTPSVVNNIAKSFNLNYFKTKLGVEGLKKEL